MQYYRAFDAAEPSDLYSALQEALDESEVTLPSGLSVSTILTSWDSLAGFPVVYVDVDTEAKSVTFRQVWYYIVFYF